jgi:hypothetical protein
MAIKFNCDCGQTITARDEYAGRKVQCVGCKKVHVVPGERKPATQAMPRPAALRPPAPLPPLSPPPGPSEAAETLIAPPPTVPPPPVQYESPPLGTPDFEDEKPAPPPPSRPAPVVPAGRADVVRFRCACGSEFFAKPEFAGEPTRCTHCSEILFIPTRQAAARTDGRPVKVGFDRGDRYQPPRESDSRWMGALIALLTLLLMGGGAYAYWEFYLKDFKPAGSQAVVPPMGGNPGNIAPPGGFPPGGGFPGGGFPGGGRPGGAGGGGRPGGGFPGVGGGFPGGGRPGGGGQERPPQERPITDENGEQASQAGLMTAGENLKQVAKAMIAYADAHNGQLPPQAVLDKEKKPLYSWRVLLLPYLGENELYQKLKLDESWNSPHNGPLLASTPKLFQMPLERMRPGLTVFVVCQGEGTAFPPDRPLNFSDGFKDGTANTLLIVEAALPVHWASPGDIFLTPEVNAKMRLGTRSGKGTLAAFADGSVRILPKTITEKELRAYITPAGGEPVPQP